MKVLSYPRWQYQMTRVIIHWRSIENLTTITSELSRLGKLYMDMSLASPWIKVIPPTFPVRRSGLIIRITGKGISWWVWTCSQLSTRGSIFKYKISVACLGIKFKFLSVNQRISPYCCQCPKPWRSAERDLNAGRTLPRVGYLLVCDPCSQVGSDKPRRPCLLRVFRLPMPESGSMHSFMDELWGICLYKKLAQ